MVPKFLKSPVQRTAGSLGYVVLRQKDLERHSVQLSREKADALHWLEEAMDQVRRLTIKI